MLLNFADSLITKEQMSKVKGGCGGGCTFTFDIGYSGCQTTGPISFYPCSQSSAVSTCEAYMSQYGYTGYNLSC